MQGISAQDHGQAPHPIHPGSAELPSHEKHYNYLIDPQVKLSSSSHVRVTPISLAQSVPGQSKNLA